MYYIGSLSDNMKIDRRKMAKKKQMGDVNLLLNKD